MSNNTSWDQSQTLFINCPYCVSVRLHGDWRHGDIQMSRTPPVISFPAPKITLLCLVIFLFINGWKEDLSWFQVTSTQAEYWLVHLSTFCDWTFYLSSFVNVQLTEVYPILRNISSYSSLLVRYVLYIWSSYMQYNVGNWALVAVNIEIKATGKHISY